MPRRKQPPIKGVITTSIRLPAIVHEEMQIIQSVRRDIEQGDIRLWRLYREAVEYWLNARPQREILERYRALAADPRPDPEADGVLRAGM